MDTSTTCCPPLHQRRLLYRIEGSRVFSAVPLATDIDTSLGVHKESDDETVETQDFGENEDKNHADEKSRLLSGSSYTCITNDTNGETSSQTSQTHRKTRTELNKPRVERKLLGQPVGDQDGNDKAVDTNDTSHNDGDDVWTS